MRDQYAAALALSESAVDDLTILAPISGVILTKNYEEGEYAAAGAPIATIADPSDCWVKIYVSSADLGNLRLGGKADVMIDTLPDRIFEGRIKEISDTAEYTPRQSITKDERANLVFAVKVAVDNKECIMKPGMPADVRLHE